MEFHLILSVAMAMRTVIRAADRWLFGSSVVALGLEFLIPRPLETLSSNPILVPPLKRPIGFLICWLLWFLPLCLLMAAIVPPVSQAVHTFLKLPGVESDFILGMLIVSGLGALTGTIYLAYQLTKGVRIELTDRGAVFSRNVRSVLVPWQVWLTTGPPRRKSWNSSQILIPCPRFQEVGLLGSSLTGTLVQGMPVSVDVIEGAAHLVLWDDACIQGNQIVEICQGIALMSASD